MVQAPISLSPAQTTTVLISAYARMFLCRHFCKWTLMECGHLHMAHFIACAKVPILLRAEFASSIQCYHVLMLHRPEEGHPGSLPLWVTLNNAVRSLEAAKSGRWTYFGSLGYKSNRLIHRVILSLKIFNISRAASLFCGPTKQRTGAVSPQHCHHIILMVTYTSRTVSGT